MEWRPPDGRGVLSQNTPFFCVWRDWQLVGQILVNCHYYLAGAAGVPSWDVQAGQRVAFMSISLKQ